MAVLDSLFVKLGYDVDQDKVDAFNEGVDNTARRMKKVTLSAIAAASAIAFIVKKMAVFATTQLNNAKALGVSSNALIQWRDTLEILTGSADLANSSLAKMGQILDGIPFGKVDNDFLLFLSNINLELDDIEGLSREDALKKIILNFQKLPDNMKTSVAALSGFSELLLKIGKQDFLGELNRNISDIDFTKLDEFRRKWDDMTQAIRNASIEIANVFLPTVNKALDSLGKTIEERGNQYARVLSGDFSPITDDLETISKSIKGFIGADNLDAADQLFSADTLRDLGNFISGENTFTAPETIGNSVTGAINRSNSTTTVNNDVKIVVKADKPTQAGKEVEKAFERINRTALENIATPEAR